MQLHYKSKKRTDNFLLLDIFLEYFWYLCLRFTVEEKMTYPMWQSEHIYAWHAKWVVSMREKRNMATLTLQFKIKHGLEWGELVREAYANISKWTYWPNATCKRNGKTFLLTEIVLNSKKFLWKANTWISFIHDTEQRKIAGKANTWINFTSYLGENDRGEVWFRNHPWRFYIWTISGQVDGESWVGLQDVPNETFIAQRPIEADK